MKSGSSRYGLVLFAVYLLFYGGFVVVNAVAPEKMEATVLFGLNTAVVYGFLCGDASRDRDVEGVQQ